MKPHRRKHLVTTLEEWKGLHLQGQPPRLLLDHEQRAFVDECLTCMTFMEIEIACRERFGPKRGVGHATVHRYWQNKERARKKRGAR